MNMSKRSHTYIPNHPLANPSGLVRRARYILYEELNGKNANCYWCDLELIWTKERITNQLCVDHLDGNIENDDPSNLVPSCRACNANREDGTGHGRRELKPCKTCGKLFLPKRKSSIYCSVQCIERPKRGSKAQHGTRTRYNYGCNCNDCKKAQSDYMEEYEKKNPRSNR